MEPSSSTGPQHRSSRILPWAKFESLEQVAACVVGLDREVLGSNAECEPRHWRSWVLDVVIMRNPREPMDFGTHDHFGRPDRWPRLGVEFADGRRAGSRGFPMGHLLEVAKDDAGLPSEPILAPRGGGGDGSSWHLGLWLYPLPPPGPLQVYATWPVAGVDETMLELDAEDIHAAAARSVVLWD